MLWRGQRESDNVEDDGGGGGIGGRHIALGGGLGTIAIVIISLIMGKNPMQLLNQMGGSQDPNATVQQSAQPANADAGTEDSTTQFVRVVLADTEDVWAKIFADMGQQYVDPKLHLFRGATQSGCGNASSETGPFYCPVDHKVYLDESFFDELKNRFHASGDFANAYVIAHEVGHHVQNLLGVSDKVHDLQERSSEAEANKLSVKLELQADFYAGVWANHAQKMKHILETGDVDAALKAANAIGDDKLQMQSQGYVVPDAFTHGTSAERMYWFKKGFETGDIKQGDTFNDPSL